MASLTLRLIAGFCPRLFLTLCLGYCAVAEPVFDGVIRATSDGKSEAYLIPPFKSNHASNIEIIPNYGKLGVDMVTAWFSGEGEGTSGNGIVMSRLYAGSRAWTNATVMSRREGYSNQNPVLYYYNTSTVQKIFLFHSQQVAGEGETTAQIWFLESGPDGQNWTDPRAMLTKPGSFDRNRIIPSLHGTLLFPIYYSVNQFTPRESSVMEWQYAEDGGSWEEHSMEGTPVLIQPSVIRPKEGEPLLLAFFRDEINLFIYRSVSTDDGQTWSRPTKTTLPNNGSGIQACVLASGNIAMVYNPTHSERNPLVISLSDDFGLTWAYTRTLMSSPESAEFSYPSILQNPLDGSIHVTYTYLRETIKYDRIPNEDWIKQGD